MNRALALSMWGVALLLTACVDEKPSAIKPTPDDVTRRACHTVLYVVERSNHYFALNLSAGGKSSASPDVELRAAGRELLAAAEEAYALEMNSDGEVDMTQSEARIATAQQKAMAVCVGLMGEPPWA
ncbi:hypothetical protein [Micromonospora sp. NBC_01412]|uniref:hypothetical protein n=1 Tax=Micromonospora sp. NBC_01412 TaxID=2903590 RepID=UPI00324C7F34